MKFDARDPVSVEDLYPAGGYRVGKRLVEISSWNLVSIFPALGELIGKIKVAGLLAAQKDRAALLHEMLRLHRLQQASLLQQVHGVRQQAFPNDKPGKNLF